MSALRNSWSGSLPSAGAMAMPMLVPMITWWPWTSNGSEKRLDQLGGKLAGVGRPGAALHDGEFVAAEAGHRIDAAHHALQPLGHRAEQRIADRMAERIVDALEAVEVEEHDRELFAAAERLLHLVAEQHAVRQIGQRVVARHVHDLGLGLAALGDVFIGHDHAAVGRRAVEA